MLEGAAASVNYSYVQAQLQCCLNVPGKLVSHTAERLLCREQRGLRASPGCCCASKPQRCACACRCVQKLMTSYTGCVRRGMKPSQSMANLQRRSSGPRALMGAIGRNLADRSAHGGSAYSRCKGLFYSILDIPLGGCARGLCRPCSLLRRWSTGKQRRNGVPRIFPGFHPVQDYCCCDRIHIVIGETAGKQRGNRFPPGFQPHAGLLLL